MNEETLTSVNVDSTCSRMFSPWLGGFCWVRTTNLLNRSNEPSPIRIPPRFRERSFSIGIGVLFRCHTRLHNGKHWTTQCNWTLFWWYGMPVITQKFSQKKTTMQWQCTWNWRKTLYKSWWRVDSYGSGSRLCHTHPVKGNAGVIPGRIDVSMVEGQPKVCPPLDFMTIVKPPDHGSRRKTRIFHSTFDLKCHSSYSIPASSEEDYILCSASILYFWSQTLEKNAWDLNKLLSRFKGRRLF